MRGEGFARPLTLDVENTDLLGSVNGCVALLEDRRRHALNLLDELCANRDRIRRTTALTGFVSSALAGLIINVATGSLLLGHLTPFEHLWRPSAPRFKNSGSPRF